MRCEVCGYELSVVDVWSSCVQKATVDSNGNIKSYGQTYAVDTHRIECQDCGADVSDLIKE